MDTLLMACETLQLWVSTIGWLMLLAFPFYYRRPTTRRNRLRWKNAEDVDIFIAWYIYGDIDRGR